MSRPGRSQKGGLEASRFDVRTVRSAITIRNPWAALIVSGIKDFENRKWLTTFRGWCLVSTSKNTTETEYQNARALVRAKAVQIDKGIQLHGDRVHGSIIGAMRIDDCLDVPQYRAGEYKSGWFQGPYGFRIGAVVRLPFVECVGKLGFWRVDSDLRNALIAATGAGRGGKHSPSTLVPPGVNDGLKECYFHMQATARPGSAEQRYLDL